MDCHVCKQKVNKNQDHFTCPECKKNGREFAVHKKCVINFIKTDGSPCPVCKKPHGDDNLFAELHHSGFHCRHPSDLCTYYIKYEDKYI